MSRSLVNVFEVGRSRVKNGGKQRGRESKSKGRRVEFTLELLARREEGRTANELLKNSYVI